MAEPLTSDQRAALLEVLARFSGGIERVDLYGSRARGTHRPGSDVDLVIVGTMDADAKGALELALEESHLSLFADVKLESEIAASALAPEVARDRRMLFSHAELCGQAGL